MSTEVKLTDSDPLVNVPAVPQVDPSEMKFTLLSPNGHDLNSILSSFQHTQLAQFLMKLHDNCFDTKDMDNSQLSILACSMAGWICAANLNHEIGDRLHDKLEHWLHANFCFGKKLFAHFHSSPAESISVILRSMALVHEKKMTSEYTVYVSPCLTEDDSSYAMALKEWACVAVLDLPQRNDGTVDYEALGGIIEKDKESGRKPLLIIASVGAGLAGVCDNMNALVKICKKYEIWLHVEGPRLARRIIRSLDESSPKILMQLPDVRSMTLDLGTWLGFMGGPVLTIIRPPYKVARASESGTDSTNDDLAYDQTVSIINSSWPTYAGAAYYWLLLQHLGCNEIASRLRLRLDLANRMTQEILKIDGMVVLNIKKPEPKNKEGPSERSYVGREILGAVVDAMDKEVSKPDPPIPVSVMFRYTGQLDDLSKEEDEEKSHPMAPARLNVLNQWLAESAARTAPGLFVGTVTFRHASWIRFAPFDAPLSGDVESLKKELDNFVAAMKRQVTALQATNDQRPRLAAVLQMEQFIGHLEFVALPNWAGLGAVRYYPKETTENGRKWSSQDIDAINSEIVKRLRVTDSAFSEGRALAPLVLAKPAPIDSQKDDEQSVADQTNGNMATVTCIRFGLVTADTDVEHLCASAYRVGNEIHDELKQLEEMAQVVRRGIEEANREIQMEQVTRVYEEGMLRHIPLVGNLLNWWSPPSGGKPIAGRRLNISSGRLSPTAGLSQPSPPVSPTMSLDTHQKSQEEPETPLSPEVVSVSVEPIAEPEAAASLVGASEES